ncbi:MAG: UvrD-helicase domain-containing protein [Syntrophales bacterium]|jgi:DNA helicase-2/ATP-dependent DNA helicase PcrA
MNDLPVTLAQNQGRGYVIAPAGFGKTHLIAEAVQRGTGRALILTHTYAGVNALKKKMRALGVSTSKYQVDTIASWSLRLCLSYPGNSGWAIEHPNSDQWAALYGSCSQLLTKGFILRAIRASYKKVYVDEYQDCTKAQHAMLMRLAAMLPFCLLGDPLQAIFDFADEPVEWEKDVYPYFTSLGQLTKPWRWHNAGSKEIGDWLSDVRRKLERQEQISLSSSIPKGVKVCCVDSEEAQDKKQFNTCWYFNLKGTEKVIAIHGGSAELKNKGHYLARKLSGTFSSIEEIEGTVLFSFVKKVSKARTPAGKMKPVIDFASKCMTGVNESLSAGTKRCEVVNSSKKLKCPAVTAAANSYLVCPSSDNLKNFLTALKKTPSVLPFRRDLLNRTIHVLTLHSQFPELSLEGAAIKYQGVFRHGGRPVSYPKLIGTTLLVKGLEFDHAIILDAASLSRKELYVALTRGSKSITIISSSNVLPAQAQKSTPVKEIRVAAQ